MGVQIKNNAFSTLAGAINSSATTINLAVSGGAAFPTASVASNTYFYATLIDTSNNIEVVKVTARTTDTLTVVRGQDGTTARSFTTGDRIELRVTAALLSDLPVRQLVTADHTDSSITSAKLATTGVSAGNFGGLGKATSITVNSKGQLTSVTETSGYVQRIQFDYTTTGAVQSWSKPSNAGSLVRVQMWGAGGGGARGPNTVGGGGGGGGAYLERWFDITELSSSASIVVGVGGTGATTDNFEGIAGTATTFVSGSVSMTAHPGGGGASNSTSFATGGGGGGELEAGTSATNTLMGKGGALGGGHGGYYLSGGSAATSTARGAVSLASDGTTTQDVSAVDWQNNDARTIWGGGGGGGGNNGAVTGVEAMGGYAVWGGGGGGGGYNGTQANNGAKGGISLFGGSGGDGRTGSALGMNGATPGGGGGGTETAVAGSGGNGRCIITVY